MSSQKRFKVAGIQTGCDFKGKKLRISRALELIDQAVAEDAKIVLLPELFSTKYLDYCRRSLRVFRHAEPIPGPTTEKIAEKAREHKIYIISPIFEQAAPGVYYNTAPIINPRGEIIGKYRKTHIPEIMGREKYYFRPGSRLQVFETEFGKIGILICYDNVFPEAWRVLALEGAEIIFGPTAAFYWWGRHDAKKWELRAMCRAWDNAVFAVMVNRVGKEEDFEYYGNSLIVNPEGDIISRAGNEKEEIVTAEIDLCEVTERRKGFPVFRDFRPDLYGRLTESELF